jgi:DNA-binding MarR family transcriptional regulator
MWMRCYTQQEIADAVGMEQNTISNKIADFSKNGQVSDITNFRNFEPPIYTIWNFAKARDSLE